MKVIIIDANKFSNLDGFYDEIDKKFTKNLTWKTGKNLDAFNDILWGGFGVYEYEEQIKIVWENSNKSKSDLGYDATVSYYKQILRTCHTSNIESVNKKLDLAKDKMGQTLFDIILYIIKAHEHIILHLN